ncbi:hypothetical protein QOT17_008723 [Balamuthia mandrillaris]
MGGCSCCSKPCWAFAFSLLSMFFVVSALFVPWYLVLQVEHPDSEDRPAGEGGEEADIMVQAETFWWREVFMRSYVGKHKESSSTTTYSDHDLDKVISLEQTSKVFVVSLCLVVLRALCGLFVMCATLCVLSRGTRRPMRCIKVIFFLFGLVGIASAIAALAYFSGSVAEALRDDASSRVDFLVPSKNKFWGYENLDQDKQQVYKYWGPAGWYLLIVSELWLLLAMLLICFTGSCWQSSSYEYSVLN